MESKLVSFGEALVALKQGKRVCRVGWNGQGLFVFMQVPAQISVEEVVPKMQSLPQSVKDEFERRLESANSGKNLAAKRDMPFITYSNQLALVKPNNEINGWSPSTADSLATDWIILD